MLSPFGTKQPRSKQRKALLLKKLAEGVTSLDRLAEAVGLHPRTVSTYISRMKMSGELSPEILARLSPPEKQELRKQFLPKEPKEAPIPGARQIAMRHTEPTGEFHRPHPDNWTL